MGGAAEGAECAKVQMRRGRVQKCKGELRGRGRDTGRKTFRVAGGGGELGRAAIAIAAVRDRRREVVGSSTAFGGSSTTVREGGEEGMGAGTVAGTVAETGAGTSAVSLTGASAGVVTTFALRGARAFVLIVTC